MEKDLKNLLAEKRRENIDESPVFSQIIKWIRENLFVSNREFAGFHREVVLEERRKMLFLFGGTALSVAASKITPSFFGQFQSDFMPVPREEIYTEPLPEPEKQERILFSQYRAWEKALSLHEIEKQKKDIFRLVQEEVRGFKIPFSKDIQDVAVTLQNLDAFIEPILARFGAERRLDWRHVLATIKIESSFYPRDSQQGAQGFMQMTPDTFDHVFETFKRFFPTSLRENFDIQNPKIQLIAGALYLNLCAHLVFKSYQEFIKYEEAKFRQNDEDAEIFGEAFFERTKVSPKKLSQGIRRTDAELLFSAFFAYHSGLHNVVKKGFSLFANSEGMRYAALPCLIQSYDALQAAPFISSENLEVWQEVVEERFQMKSPEKREKYAAIPGVDL